MRDGWMDRDTLRHLRSKVHELDGAAIAYRDVLDILQWDARDAPADRQFVHDSQCDTVRERIAKTEAESAALRRTVEREDQARESRRRFWYGVLFAAFAAVIILQWSGVPAQRWIGIAICYAVLPEIR